MPSVGRAACVGQEDDRRLKPLAGVDGQHAHALGLDLHVALDLRVSRLDLGEKIMERRRLALLMRQREGQEFVDRVGGFVSEPADQRESAAVLAEEARVKSERRKGLRPRAPDGEPARGCNGGSVIVRPQARRRANRSAPPRA